MDDEPSAGTDGCPASDADDNAGPDIDPHTQRAAVRDGYDGMAEDYRRWRESSASTDGAVVESFLADLDAGSRLVDAGCGQGTPVLDRLPAGVDAVGVDLSAAQLRLAEEVTDAGLVRGDMTRLPVAADAVDAVTAMGSVIHVPIGQHPSVYREFARVLRPGGRLLLTAAPDADGWSGANPDWLDTGVLMAWSFPGIDRTREQLREAGFLIVDEHRTSWSDGDHEEAWTQVVARLSDS